MYMISVTPEKYARLQKCIPLEADSFRLQTMQEVYVCLLYTSTVSGPDLEADMWGNLVEAFNQVR